MGKTGRALLAGIAVALALATPAHAAMTAAVFLVTDLIFAGTVAAIVTGITAGTFAWFWYGLPLWRRATDYMRFCDDLEFGFGWIEDETLRRTSHALAADGGVWLVDPVAWHPAEARARELGEPRGVIQLLDRHDRDGSALAARLGVPHHEVPFEPLSGAPFEFVRIIRKRFWREVALWWPERRVLVCADALGTVAYFTARDEPVGVHPFLRLWPPRRLRAVAPEHILVGHGEGVHERADDALREALRTSRRRLPAALIGNPFSRR